MRGSVRNDTTTRIITLEVSGVPDVDVAQSWHRQPRIMRPEHVTIRIVDAQVKELRAAGPLIRKNGEPGLQRADTSWWPTDVYGHQRHVDGAPEWVRTLWAQAPAGVTSWSAPAEVQA